MSIYSSAVLALNPTTYYRMSATSGTTEVDLGSDGVNATYSGTYTLNAGSLIATDPGANSVEFVSGAGELTAAPTTYFSSTQTYGFVVWVKSTTGTQLANLAYWQNSLFNVSNPSTSGPGTAIAAGINGVSANGFGTFIADGNPHMIAAIFDGSSSTISLFQDNVALGSFSLGVGQTFQTSFLAGPNHFTGYMSEFAVIPNLTATQITSLYQAATGSPAVYVQLNPPSVQTGNIEITGSISAEGGYVAPIYDASGAALGSTTHIVIGAGTGTGSAQTIALAGAAVFTSTTSYSVAVCQDTGTVDVSLTSGSSFTISATSGANYSWIAAGS